MKKYILSFILSAVAFGFAQAQESVKGIIVTYTGAEVSYKLEDVPTVRYAEVEGKLYAALYLKGMDEPVLSIPLEDNALTIAYGEYTIPTSIEDVVADKVTITSKGGKKYIQGGRLIIIGKDGRQYDVRGTLIK